MAARSVIGPRTDWVRFCVADGVLLLLERVHADHQARDAVVLVELDDPFGELDRFLDVALRQHRQEGTLQKLGFFGSPRSEAR